MVVVVLSESQNSTGDESSETSVPKKPSDGSEKNPDVDKPVKGPDKGPDDAGANPPFLPAGVTKTASRGEYLNTKDGTILLWPIVLILAVVLFLYLFGMEGVDKVIYWAGLLLFAPD